MNCLEFRRDIASAPLGLSMAAQAHRDACARCAEAERRALQFEQRVSAALSVAVPDGLAERILLKQTTLARQEQRVSTRQTWLRLAAGVVMTMAVGSVAYLGLRSGDSLASASIEHLSHEPFALTATDPIPAAEVSRIFAESGVNLRVPLTQVTYLTRCPVGGQRTIHMVIRQQGQIVTALFVPGSQLGEANFGENKVVGRHLEIGDGTLVLLADSSSAFDHIAAEFRAAIEP